MQGENLSMDVSKGSHFMPEEAFTDPSNFVIYSKDHRSLKEIATSIKFLKAGPRKFIYHNPDDVKACIVTCGGLCPGLNVVIREVVMSLWFNYEVR